jgi:hypothetical protein
MRRIFLLAWIGTISLFAQNRASIPVTLHWKNLLPRYTSIDQIKPVLANDDKHSAFLYGLPALGQATLERFNEKRRKWEQEDTDLVCVAQVGNTPPVVTEIKTHSEREVKFLALVPGVHSDRTKHFLVGGGAGEERPLEGRYRFFAYYTLEPQAAKHSWGDSHRINSPEFLIVKE